MPLKITSPPVPPKVMSPPPDRSGLVTMPLNKRSPRQPIPPNVISPPPMPLAKRSPPVPRSRRSPLFKRMPLPRAARHEIAAGVEARAQGGPLGVDDDDRRHAVDRRDAVLVERRVGRRIGVVDERAHERIGVVVLGAFQLRGEEGRAGREVERPGAAAQMARHLRGEGRVAHDARAAARAPRRDAHGEDGRGSAAPHAAPSDLVAPPRAGPAPRLALRSEVDGIGVSCAAALRPSAAAPWRRAPRARERKRIASSE